jgi:hypothetical protein
MPHPLKPRTPLIPPPFPLSWEPALTQLRELPLVELDALVLRWLSASGCHSVRRVEGRPGCATYQGLLGRHPFTVPLLVRVFQRRNRLQEHHVDALAGMLLRRGVPGGLLITTGSSSRPARRAGASCRVPHVSLLEGPEWAADLARCRAGVRRRYLPQWLLDLTGARRVWGAR